MCYHRNPQLLPSNSTGNLRPAITHNDINFQIDFRFFDQDFYQHWFSFPKDIDKYWIEVGCPVSFIKIYDFILRINDQNLILSIVYNKTTHPLASAFNKLQQYFCKVFDSQNLLSFISLSKLNLRFLFQSISKSSRCMFSSILALIRCILPKISSNDERQKVLTIFSNWLIPKDLTSAYGTNCSIDTILFIPVRDMKTCMMDWLILHNDATITIISFEGSYILNNACDYGISMSCEGQVLVANSRSFMFLEQSHYQFFTEGLKAPHFLIPFITSFKYAEPFSDKFPSNLKKVFSSYLSNVDFILAKSLFGQKPQLLMRDTSIQLYNCLIESGMFSPFVRYAFFQDIQATSDPGTVFRGTTIATNTASNLLSHFGSCYFDRIINEISKMQNDPKSATRVVIEFLKRVPISMQFLFSCAFRSSRRKFPNTNTPLIASGSLMTLRCIMPKMARNPELSALSKHIMNAFLFRTDDQAINDQSLLDEIRNLILTTVKMCDRSINFSNTNYSLIIKYIAKCNDEILKKLKIILDEPVPSIHPLCSSFMEIIENAFVQSSITKTKSKITTSYPQFSTDPKPSYLAQSSLNTS